MKSKRIAVSITLSNKTVRQIKEYKQYNPEFNLSRRIEMLLINNFLDDWTDKEMND